MKKKSESGLAFFIFERTDHQGVEKMRDIYKTILLNIEGQPSSLNLRGEDIIQNAAIEEASKTGNTRLVTGSAQVLSEYSHNFSVPLKVHTFTARMSQPVLLGQQVIITPQTPRRLGVVPENAPQIYIKRHKNR